MPWIQPVPVNSMAVHLPIRCHCGNVRAHAHIGHHPVGRVVCYCRDCRMFAHFLTRGNTILDAHGGTEVVPMSQGRLRFEAGGEQLACIRLTARGTLRWYAGCCNTPIGNIPSTRQLPYLGLIHACIDYAAAGRTPEALLGPITRRIHGRNLQDGGNAIGADEGIPPGILIRLAWRVFVWRLRGDQRHSPFYAPATGEPLKTPRILGADERAALTTSRT